MEAVQYILGSPWLLLVLLVPLVAPGETLLLFISLAYAFIVYMPYKVALTLYRCVKGKNKKREMDTHNTESIGSTKDTYTLEKMSCSGCGGGVFMGTMCGYCGSSYIRND